MADDIKNIAAGLGADGTSAAATATAKKKTGELGKDEFLQLLVTQLKHQDPLDPMKNEEFAVQLAQFSQLEQLMNINKTLSSSDGQGGMGSLAAYLGNVVILNGSDVTVENGNGGLLRVDLPTAASEVSVDLLDSSGNSVKTVKFDDEDTPAGKNFISLADLSLPAGSYGVKVSARGVNGTQFEPSFEVAGLVSGFVPGPTPSLLIGSRQISTADVKEVTVASRG